MKALVAVAVIVAVSGCGMATSSHDFVMAGNAEGIHAFADTLNGVIRTGKESSTEDSRFFNSREVQEKEKTKRATAPGFLQSLFASPTSGTRE